MGWFSTYVLLLNLLKEWNKTAINMLYDEQFNNHLVNHKIILAQPFLKNIQFLSTFIVCS